MYVCRISKKTKHDMSDTLADIAQPPKQQKLDTPKQKFQFKAIAPATVYKPEQEAPTETAKPLQQNEAQFDLQPLDNTPPDDVLLNFLQQFDPVTEQPPPNLAPMYQPQVLQPIPPPVANNLMNTNNVQNVQNVANPNHNMMPNMYFGGHSSVTINYNFSAK